MLDPVGFWSYARQDDAHSDGQLSQLRAIVGRAIVLQCGVEVVVWQDVAAIPYGADWAETIERTLGQTTFFIPIVTPRFLKSENCRDEYLGFRRRMQTLGRNDLVFSRALCRRRGNGAGRDGVRRRSRRVAPLAMDRLPAAVLFRHEIAGGAALGGGFGGERAEGAAAARNGSVSRAGAYARGFGPADGFALGARGRWLGARGRWLGARAHRTGAAKDARRPAAGFAARQRSLAGETG
jgi:hypothetical protein